MSQERQKHFSFVQAKYSLGVTHLCRGCEAADYLLEVLKTFDGSTLCAKHILERGSGVCPLSLPPQEFRGCISEGESAGYPHLTQLCLLSDEYYSAQTTSSGLPDLHKE